VATLLGFTGSAREASFNTRILRSLGSLAPEGVEVKVFDVDQIPFYNQDLEGDALPASIQALRDAVAAADGVIVASPEYNHSYSALAKNVIDWASRPFGQGSILGKKAMILVAGPGPGGGAHCIEELGKLFGLLGCTVVSSVGVAKAHEKIDAATGAVTDEALAAELTAALAAF
jgi:chromate reductase